MWWLWRGCGGVDGDCDEVGVLWRWWLLWGSCGGGDGSGVCGSSAGDGVVGKLCVEVMRSA